MGGIHAPLFAQEQAILPPGVHAIWDLARAWNEATPTRQRICINGLWRWQPAGANETPPAQGWGYFKVPGCWPGISDYLQKDSQNVYVNPAWQDVSLSKVQRAWYQREVEVPKEWEGRRISLSVAYLNSLATVYVDTTKVGTIQFPGGELDLSGHCRPGEKHVISLLVLALPLKDLMTAYRDTATARQVKGTVPRRGLCGDVFLVSTPSAARLSDVRIDTSVRNQQLTIDAGFEGLPADGKYGLKTVISRDGHDVATLSSALFAPAEVVNGRFASSHKWMPDKLWDLNAAGNMYDARVSLVDSTGKVLDTSWPIHFGFREFRIDGRDFYLNRNRIHLSAVPIDNALIGAASANYAAVRRTLERLKQIGVNVVYTHHYDCLPGSHLELDELLRAADDVGMLVSLTQPHFAQYDWTAHHADENNGYAAHAAFYVRVAENHPSVVFYSMSHNATGYDQDMNPDLIDGVHAPRETWSARNVRLALRAEAIVHHLDPSRIIYHHAGGNIGSMDTINFYPNFAPIQELDDWFAHWAVEGVKPLFLCEYGAPFTWDWTMYRGWYKGKREFGSAEVSWEFCLAEWDAQFLGDRAFADNARQDANLKWEARQFAAGNVWHRWSYPTSVGSPSFDDRNEVLARYLADNWRAYRTWGVSGISPWEYEIYWTARDGVERGRRPVAVDWTHLQRPGLSPDYIVPQADRMDTDFEPADWTPTAAGRALLRNNQPVLAYIAGGAPDFTAKDHNFYAGQRVEKQLIVINDSRAPLAFHCDWSLALPPGQTLAGERQVTVDTGQQARIPLQFDLSATLSAGTYTLHARARFGDGQEQDDAFAIHVLAPMAAPRDASKPVMLFDPKGVTAALLDRLRIGYHRIDADAHVPPDQILVVGKMALTADGPAPDISAVREGLKVIVFEQASDALEKRLGFRVTEYGLRQVFPRIAGHPALSGIDVDQLQDWSGQATTMPARLSYEMLPQHGPTVQWCGIPVSRVWRCGNRGNVASVLIEKPARGDFLPILDGGFSLQFSPLMEYHQGRGMVLFCQMDVTGRTRADPAADRLVANLVRYASDWKPPAARRAVYAGSSAGAAYLKSAGIEFTMYAGATPLPADQTVIVAHGFDRASAPNATAVARFIKDGGRLLTIALDQQELDSILPEKVRVKSASHVSTVFPLASMQSSLAGVGPADVYDRAPREMPLVADGADVIGDGVLGLAPIGSKSSNIVLCQIAPWEFDYQHNYGLKRTFRRASFLLARLLANEGIASPTPLLDRFHTPPMAGAPPRWLDGFYLDVPEECDDPYRFFRW
jgi:hypothetical protein